MIECCVGIGVGHMANSGQVDWLAIWIPATWKLVGRALGPRLWLQGLRLCHKAPGSEPADVEEGERMVVFGGISHVLARYCAFLNMVSMK